MRMGGLVIRALLIDMDGVLFHGDQVLPGAAAFLRRVGGVPHCFVTNNPIRSPGQIAEHFDRLSLPIPALDRIVTSAEATLTWLVKQKPGFRFFAIGASTLHETLASQGNADAQDADFVVVGEGAGIDYASISTAINLILKRGAQLICTNPDNTVDASCGGQHCVLPGGGALVAPIAIATGVEPVFVGKPNPLLYQMAIKRLGASISDCVMVGDRPDTDIAGAQALGMHTALVRTGRFASGDRLPAGIMPTWDCTSLTELMDQWTATSALRDVDH